MMNKITTHFYFAIVIFLLLVSCKLPKEKTEIAKLKMSITFNVVPEDYERNLYYVEWEDTLGQSESYTGDKQLNRPTEVWCVITNDRKDTLGNYQGLGTARTFTGFQTKEDTTVTLHFMIRLNMFTDKFDKGQSLSEQYKAAQDYAYKNKLPVMFKPIQINLKTDLRKKHTIELEEQ